MCSERWMADLASWRYFCMRCTQLTQFDWLCVPFATKFFEIFGQTPKPQLRKLTMTSAHNWKWSRHLEQVSTAERDELKSCGYARTAKDALKVLDACPALEELQMKWYMPPTASHKANMNANIFGDDFCEKAVRMCPSHTTFTHKQVRGLARPLRVLETFTDRSMLAMAKLQHLKDVRLTHVGITGARLFELVVNHAHETRAARQYDIALSNWTPLHGFYSALKGFLQRLASFKGEIPCATHPVSLQLEGDRLKVNKSWSIDETAAIRSLVAQITAKNPYIGFRGLLDTEDNGISFSSLLAFQFTTRKPQEPTPWSWYVDRGTGSDLRIDDVFERRIFPVSPPVEAGNEEADDDDHDENEAMADWEEDDHDDHNDHEDEDDSEEDSDEDMDDEKERL